MLIEKKRFMVQHVDSPDFFLILNFADADPEFTRDIEIASTYTNEDIAEAAIERVRLKGFGMALKPVPLQIIFNVGV